MKYHLIFPSRLFVKAINIPAFVQLLDERNINKLLRLGCLCKGILLADLLQSKLYAFDRRIRLSQVDLCVVIISVLDLLHISTPRIP